MLDFSSVLFQFQFQWNYFIYYRYVIYVHTLYKSALRQNPSETRISTCIQIGKLPSRTRQIYVKVFVECCVRHLSVYFILYTLWMIFSPRQGKYLMMARRALHRCQLGKCQDYLVPANPLLLEGEHSCRGAGACRLIREYIYFLFALSMQLSIPYTVQRGPFAWRRGRLAVASFSYCFLPAHHNIVWGASEK